MDRPGGTVLEVRKRGRRRAGHSTSVRYPVRARQSGANVFWTRAAILVCCSATAVVWQCEVVSALRTGKIPIGEDSWPLRASQHPVWFWVSVASLQGLAVMIF